MGVFSCRVKPFAAVGEGLVEVAETGFWGAGGLGVPGVSTHIHLRKPVIKHKLFKIMLLRAAL